MCSRVTFDARGAVISADLYIPAGTSDEDSLPAVTIAHGRGVTKGTFKSFAEELARRGFVVLNVDCYGVGLSEVPVNEELGAGANSPGGELDYNTHPMSVLDAANYLRSLKYVDTTRIGILGQSGGARRAGAAVVADCGYYTFNDVMINVLHDEFGIDFTEQEIFDDADAIAQKKLSEDMLAFYNYRRDELLEEYNNRVKSVCLLGSDASVVFKQSTVQVAGYDVNRNVQTCLGIINGGNDTGYRDFPGRDTTKEAIYLGENNMEIESWYLIDDNNKTSTVFGNFRTSSIVDDEEFANTLNNGVVRLYVSSPLESHSKAFFSRQTTENVVHYFEETLNYNRGNLTDSSTTPLDAGSHLFVIREVLNGIAMLAMIGLMFPVFALLINRDNAEFVPVDASKLTYKYSKKQYWIFAVLSALFGLYAIYRGNKANLGPMAPRYFLNLFPQISTYRNVELFILYVAIASVIMLCIYAFLSKKANGDSGLKRLGIAIPFKTILKYLIFAFAALVFSYILLLVSEYLFNQDFRFWMAVFTDMKVEDWGYAFCFFVIFTPMYLAINAAINYSTRTDISAVKDDIICVIINSAGVWLCFLIQIIFLFTMQKDFSNFICSYQVVLIVPITVVIARVTYRMTNSIWLGTFTNAMFVAWSLVSGTGASDFYIPIGIFARILGA